LVGNGKTLGMFFPPLSFAERLGGEEI